MDRTGYFAVLLSQILERISTLLLGVSRSTADDMEWLVQHIEQLTMDFEHRVSR